MKKIDIDQINIEELTLPGIHIYDGIAGSAKTSTVVHLLQASGCEYVHTTATNKLRRDIIARFGGNAYTVAGALFNTVDGHFYDNEKKPPAPVVVIDEILQTVPAVFDWIDKNKSNTSIIVCTDTKQMLSPVVGESCLERYHKCIEQYGGYSLEYSYRPVDDVTRLWYNKGYEANPNALNMFAKIAKEFPHTSPEQVEYSENDAYICHTNAAESNIYKRYGLKDRYDLQLIQKGGIASKNVKDIRRYPILPQDMAQKMGMGANYFQISNVGSVIRFQGTEILPGHKCYFYVSDGAYVTNRECYTMLTRCKDINSIVIVDCQDDKDIMPPSVYMGCPVIKSEWLIKNDFNETTPKKDIDWELHKANLNNNDVYYKGVLSHGKQIPPFVHKRSDNSVTISGLLRKQPELALTKPNLFFTNIDKTGIGQYCNGRVSSPNNFDESHEQKRRFDEYGYILDLFSAYPNAWHNIPMIDGESYRPEMDGAIKMYVNRYCVYGQCGQIITDRLADMYKEEENVVFMPIGSFDKCNRTYIGDYLHKQAYDTQETKKALAGIHYGLLQRDYLSPVKYDKENKPTAYTINDRNLYFPVIVCIQSEICRVMGECKKRIYGDYSHGKTVVDGLYFNTNEDITALGNELKRMLHGYDFRIVKNDTTIKKTADKPILYKSYDDLPTKKEKEKIKRQIKRTTKTSPV